MGKLKIKTLPVLIGLFLVIGAGFAAYFLLSPEMKKLVFVNRWPFWIGGAAIGGFVVLFFLGAGNQLGVSTGFSDLCSIPHKKEALGSWRLPFLLGLIVGGFFAGYAAKGGFSYTFVMGAFDTTFTSTFAFKAIIFSLGGILIGFGTRLAGGCTSGHGIVGMALFAPASIISTLTFMAAGFVVTNVLIRVFGG